MALASLLFRASGFVQTWFRFARESFRLTGRWASFGSAMTKRSMSPRATTSSRSRVVPGMRQRSAKSLPRRAERE